MRAGAEAGDAERVEESWAPRLLEIEGDDAATARRLGLGLVLSWGFGLTVAVVTGAWTASFGVPAMLALVGSVGVPSVVVGLVLARSDLDARDAARAAVHGIATTGLLLGGLAPATWLYLVGTTDPFLRWIVLSVVVTAAGTVGLARMGHALFTRARTEGTRVASLLLVAAFALFSGVLGLRVWGDVGTSLAARDTAVAGSAGGAR